MGRSALTLWYWPLALLLLADLVIRPILINNTLIKLTSIPYNNETRMEVVTWPSSSASCMSCGYQDDVTFSLRINWTISSPLPHATLALFASFDMESWFVPSEPGLIDGPEGSHTFNDGCYGSPGSLYLVTCVYNGALGPLSQGSGPFKIDAWYHYCDFFENRCDTTCGIFQKVPSCANSTITTFGYATRDYPDRAFPAKSFSWFFIVFCVLSLNEYLVQFVNALIVIFFWVQPPTDLNAKAQHTAERTDAHRRLALNVVTCTGSVQVNRLIRLILNIYLSLADAPDVISGEHVDLSSIYNHDRPDYKSQILSPAASAPCLATYYIRFERSRFSEDEMRDLLLVAATVRAVVAAHQGRMTFLFDYVQNCFDDMFFAPERLLDAATHARVRSMAYDGTVPLTVASINKEFSWMVVGCEDSAANSMAAQTGMGVNGVSTNNLSFTNEGEKKDHIIIDYHHDNNHGESLAALTVDQPNESPQNYRASQGAFFSDRATDLAHQNTSASSKPASASITRVAPNMRVCILGRDEAPPACLKYGAASDTALGLEALLAHTPEVEKGKVHGLNAVVRRILACEEVAAELVADPAARPRSVLAIIDDRHFPTKLFWAAGLPLLRRYSYRFVQFAQQFVAVMFEDGKEKPAGAAAMATSSSFNVDTLDIANGMYYYFANSLRNLLHSVASAGTNAIWDLQPFQDDGSRFSYSVETYVEDTETSHDAFFRGEKAYYVGEADVFYVRGIAKPPSQYATSLQRWSFGALQLFTKHLWHSTASSHLIVFFGFIRAIIIGSFLYLILFVENAQLYLLIAAGVLLVLAHLLHARQRLNSLLTYMLIFNDSTYWLTGILSPIVWIIFLPVWSFLEGEQLLNINIQAYVAMLVLGQIVQWALLLFVKCQSHLKESHIHNARMLYYVGYNVFLYNIVYALWRKLWDDGRITNKSNDSTWFQKDSIFFAFVRILLLLEFGVQVAAFTHAMIQLLRDNTRLDVYSTYFIFAVNFFMHIILMIKPVALIVFNKAVTFSARHIILITTAIYIILYFDTITEWANVCYILPSDICQV